MNYSIQVLGGTYPSFDSGGGGPVYSAEDGHYWDDGSTQSPTGVEVNRFLTDFDYQAPQLEPGFVDFHNLIEEDINNYVTHDDFEPVTRFNHEKWNDLVHNRGDDYEDNILYFDIDVGFLLDYLKERQAALILAYFQSRKVTDLSEKIDFEIVDKSKITHFEGSAILDCRWVRPETYPIGELHWFCPIFADTYSDSAKQRKEENRDIKFQTYRGYDFSPKEVLNEQGFSEKGFNRPVTPTDNFDELLSNYDWVFFDMAVLEKYVESKEGSVDWVSRQCGQVSWKNKLNLRISRNSKHEVVIFLDELKSIYDTEVPHWKSHNRRPSGEVPEEAIVTGALGQFVESDSYSNAVFKAIESLDNTFEQRYGAVLFSTVDDESTVEKVIMPTRNQRSHLLNSMDNLNKSFIERIKAENVLSVLPDKRKESAEGQKSALYELTAEVFGDSRANEIFKPINAVYDLRTVAAHRGQSKWAQAMESLDIDPSTKEYREVYTIIMTSLVDSLEAIEEGLKQDQS